MITRGLVVLAGRRPAVLVAVPLQQGRPARLLPIPGAARHLQLSGDLVLVPGEDTDTLSVVDPSSGSVVSSTPVGDHPHDAVDVDGTFVVTEEDHHSLGFVRDGKKIGEVDGLDTAGGIAAFGGRAAAVEVRGRVLTVVDVARRKVVAKVPVGKGPTHVVALDHGLVAVTDTSGDQVFVVRITGAPKVVSRLPLSARPYGMTFDAARDVLWVATGADNLLHALCLVDQQLSAGKTWRTVQQPNSLAVVPDSGAVVVVGATSPGRLQVITP